MFTSLHVLMQILIIDNKKRSFIYVIIINDIISCILDLKIDFKSNNFNVKQLKSYIKIKIYLFY